MENDSSRFSGRPEKVTWAQRFGLFFYDRQEMTILFWVTLIIFGVLSYGIFMKRQGFPAVDVPVSVISGTYFVQDPSQVDRDIAQPISNVIDDIPEVEAVTAQGGANFFSVIVEFTEGTSSRSGTKRVQEEIESKASLPPEAAITYKAIDASKYAEEFDALISVYSTKQNHDPQTLERQADTLAQALGEREGVGRAATVKQFETGVNPMTGQAATEQQRFDRIGLRTNDKTVFYPSVTVGIVGEKNQDTLELSENIHTALDELSNDRDLRDLGMVVSADFAEGIESQTGSLEHSLLEGLVVVLLVSFILISWRASLTSALSMVTVILITVAALYATGNTLNTVTLFALILSLGLIVDDTTIKVEAIDAAKHEHRRKRSIVAIAAGRVSRASAIGTAITMLGFAPMLFVGGVLGDFIRVLPITIMISLGLSLLISLVLVPILSSSIILRGRPKKTKNPISNLEQRASNGLARLLLVGQRSRRKGILLSGVALLIGVVMIGASLPFFQKLKFDIFPATKDSDLMKVALRFPPGTTIDQAQATTDQADKIIGDTLKDTLKRLTYQTSGSTIEAEATIDLISYKEREVSSPVLVKRLDQAFKSFRGAEVKVSQLDAGPPAEDLPFRLQIFSEDRHVANRLATDIVAFLDERELERTTGGTAHITQVEVITPDQISRKNGRQFVEVGAGFNADDTSALVTTTRDLVKAEFTASRLESYGLEPQDLAFDFGAESDNQESFQTMVIALPFLLLTMYTLMAIQFRSYLQPLLIFSAIPYSFFGVAAGLYLTDNPLSFFVLVGFFALIGIAINNTLLLADYANRAQAEGFTAREAMARSIKARFRPLLTTSLTSIVALIPLALSDPFWESLSYTLIFGLLSSTFLVIITFPYVYLAGESLRGFGKKLWHRQLPPVLQYPLDLIIAPIRLVRFVGHIVFRQTY